MNFVNLTPHPVRFRREAANTAAEPAETDIVVPSHMGEDGKPAPARLPSQPGERLDDLDGVPAYGRTTYSEPQGLPAPQDGTIYLVSVMFAGKVGDRVDVFIPGTGPQDGTVRNAEGQVYAVTRLNQA